MKKHLALLLSIAIVVGTLTPVSVFADAFSYSSYDASGDASGDPTYETSGKCGENVKWSFDTKTGTLSITGSGEMWNFSFYTSPWNKLLGDVKSVNIESGVTGIGSYAFAGCTGLTSIEIPSSVTSIGKSAFEGCHKLKKINIPNGVITIGPRAFQQCLELEKVIIPGSVTKIDYQAFNYNFFIHDVYILNESCEIGEEAIGYRSDEALCAKLDPTIHGFAESTAEEYARKNGFSFEEINLSGTTGDCMWELDGDGVLTISGKGCMEDYEWNNPAPWGTDIKKIVIDEGVTNIGNCAFDGCTGLTSIKIPNSVKSIGDDAFYWCTGITNIEIPNSVTSIGLNAFGYCAGITSIEIPSGVSSIPNGAFGHCTGLTSIEIPDSVTSIGGYAFADCTGLTSIEIPSSVTSIPNGVFSCCTCLTSVEIPSSVTSIGLNTFNACTGLTSIEIPSSVTSIGSLAFGWCALTVYYHEGCPFVGEQFGGTLTWVKLPEKTVSGKVGETFSLSLELKVSDLEQVEGFNGTFIYEDPKTKEIKQVTPKVNDGKYKLAFDNIPMYNIANDLHLKAGDMEIKGVSVINYFKSLYESNKSDDKFVKFLANTIQFSKNFNSYAQGQYEGDETFAPADIDLTDMEWVEKNATSEVPQVSATKHTNLKANDHMDKYCIKAATINVNEKFSLAFDVFNKEGQNGVKLSYAGRTINVPGDREGAEHVKYVGNDAYRVYFELAPSEYDDDLVATLYDGSTKIQEVAYSINRYCFNVRNSIIATGTKTLGQLAKDIYNYGLAAEKYLAK